VKVKGREGLESALDGEKKGGIDHTTLSRRERSGPYSKRKKKKGEPVFTVMWKKE